MPLFRLSALLCRTTFAALPLLTLALALPAAHADTTIDNPGDRSGFFGWGSVASGSTPTYGQTITAPTGESLLTSFTLTFTFGPGGQAYRAYVYAWNGSTITGSALFTSDLLTAPMAPDADVPVTISTGSVAVTAGSQYALLFSTLGEASSSSGYEFRTNSDDSSYTGGTFITNDRGAGNPNTTVASLTAGGWDSQNRDLAFTATFINAAAAAPEPGSIALLLTAGVPVAGLVRRRRKH